MSNYNNATFVSLGEGCCIGMVLRELKYRSNAYPFDWLINVTPKILLEAFKSEFSDMWPTKDEILKIREDQMNDLLVQKFVKEFGLDKTPANDAELFGGYYKKMYDKYLENTKNIENKQNTDDILSFRDFLYRIKYRYFKGSIRGDYFFPNKYGMIMVHELKHHYFKKNDEDKLDIYQFDDLWSKYERRVERLKNMLESGNNDNPVVFLFAGYTSLIFPEDDGEEDWNYLIELRDFIVEKYPKLDFRIETFNVVRSSRTDKNLINHYYDWNFLKNPIKQLRINILNFMRKKYKKV
tara:strand:+ start:5933 stop:6817 length:885 start_codon:yes stop_codon:yes gene_type:complete